MFATFRQGVSDSYMNTHTSKASSACELNFICG